MTLTSLGVTLLNISSVMTGGWSGSGLTSSTSGVIEQASEDCDAAASDSSNNAAIPARRSSWLSQSEELIDDDDRWCGRRTRVTPALLSFAVTLLAVAAVLVVGREAMTKGGVVSQREALTMTMTRMTRLHSLLGVRASSHCRFFG